MAKVRFSEETLFIIRSYSENFDKMFYYQSPFDWTDSPSLATIFRNFETAEVHMISTYHTHGDDGATYDVVPYRGELATANAQDPKYP